MKPDTSNINENDARDISIKVGKVDKFKVDIFKSNYYVIYFSGASNSQCCRFVADHNKHKKQIIFEELL